MQSAEQDNTPLCICTSLLHDSCSVYTEINNLYIDLESKLSGAPQQISDILTQLNSRQNQVKDIDDRINHSLQEISSISDECKALLVQRETLLHDTMSRNKTISQKASAIKSHLQHEVASLSTNRNAINGYRPPEQTSRALINRRF